MAVATWARLVVHADGTPAVSEKGNGKRKIGNQLWKYFFEMCDRVKIPE
jgi:hypothetical protein